MNISLSPFTSIESLREAHSELMKELRGEQKERFEERIQEFIALGRASGIWLDTEEHRDAAQNILDFWATILCRNGRTMPDSTLEDFNLALAPALDDSLCPYVGLHSFRERESENFFGRDRLVAHALQYLRRHRLLAVVGSSGCGKSSLVLAGIVPQLKAGMPLLKEKAMPASASWEFVGPLVPGRNPREGLASLLQVPPDRPTVFLIDQFEELFTLCDDEVLREEVIQSIVRLIEYPLIRHTVILTLRRDYEDQVTRYVRFQEQFDSARVEVGTLRAGELREAILRPAERVGLKFDDGLVEKLVQDILGEPTALPLLQFSLLRLWQNRERNRVTWRAYKKVGNAREALTLCADELYHSLIAEQQRTVRRILLRLVRPSHGNEFVSNRVSRGVLCKLEDPKRVMAVLDKLLAAGLIRASFASVPEDAQVEVAHEALVRNWRLLSQWLDEEREAIKGRWLLTDAAQQWIKLGRTPDALWRGHLLDEARRHKDLSEVEGDFVRESDEAVKRQMELEKSQQRDATEQAIQLAAKQRELADLRGWWIKLWIVVAIVSVAICLYLGIMVRYYKEDYVQARSNELAAMAVGQKAVDPERSVLLAINAAELVRRRGGTLAPEVTEALTYRPSQSETLTGHTASVRTVAFNRAGTRLATGGFDRTVILWDKAKDGWRASTPLAHNAPVWDLSWNEAHGRLAVTTLSGGLKLWNIAQAEYTEEQAPTVSGTVQVAAFSPDGSLFAVGTAEGKVLLYRVQLSSGTPSYVFLQEVASHKDSVWKVAFSRDGNWLGSASLDKTAHVFHLERRTSINLIGHNDRVYSIDFSADGSKVATASVDNDVRIWVLPDGRPIARIPHKDAVIDIEFSPDSHRLATASLDNVIYLWDANDFSHVDSLQGHTDSVLNLSFSSDGQWLASVSEDRTVRIWYATLGKRDHSIRIGHSAPIFGLSFSSDDTLLSSASYDRTGRVWFLAPKATGTGRVMFEQREGVDSIELKGHEERVQGIAFHPKDRSIVATAGLDRKVCFWKLGAKTATREYCLPHDQPVASLAFDPSGERLVTASWDKIARIWDLRNRSKTPQVLRGHSDWVYATAFSPDGRWIATTGRDKAVIVWDSSSQQELTRCTGHQGTVYSVGFHPGALSIVTAGSDNLVKVWQLNTDAADPKKRCELVADLPHDSSVRQAVFSPEKSSWRIATAAADRLARIWERTDRQDFRGQPWREAIRITHREAVRTVAFNGDGTSLASAGSDDAVYLTPSSMDRLVDEARSRVRRDLTREEKRRYMLDAQLAFWDLRRYF